MAERDKLRYLISAHRKIRAKVTGEVDLQVDYDDILSMLELAGSKTVADTIRKIRDSKEKLILDLKTSATMLSQAIKRLERIREMQKMEYVHKGLTERKR